MENLTKKAAFFDFDRTLISSHSQRIIAQRLWHIGQLPWNLFFSIFLWLQLHQLDLIPHSSGVFQRAYFFLKGTKVAQLQKILQELVREKIMEEMFPGGYQKIRELQEKGYEVGIVSASIEPLIQLVAKELNLSFALGTKLKEEKGFYTGEVEGEIMYGSAKVAAIKRLSQNRHWDLKESYAFSDNFSDLPLLKAVGHPVVISPSWRLRKKAEKLHWPIYNWGK